MQLVQLCEFCDDYLQASAVKDYCPNGLQVEALPEVQHLVAGVTASLALIEAAIDIGADTLLVHHGYFWNGEPPSITGPKGRRIRALIQNNINLLAYHLPLDLHPVIGNNAQLAKVMNWSIDGKFSASGVRDIVFHSTLIAPLSLSELTASIAEKLHRQPQSICAHDRPIHRIAWCTGAAQSYIQEAAKHDIDAFISGEISEHTFHFAREAGIHYIAAGHHATERYGVQALAVLISERFRLRQQFIDIPNPV